jgi:hypothetical protein
MKNSSSQTVAPNEDSQVDEIRTELRGLRETVNTLNGTIGQLNENYNDANSRLQDELNCNTTLREQLRTAQNSRPGRQSRMDVDEYNRVLHDFQRAKRELDNVIVREAEHRISMDRLREANFRAQQTVSLYESEAQRAQEHSFRNMNDARWTPRDDSTFVNKITALQKLIRNWARDHVGTNLRSDALHPDTHADVLKYLSRVVHLTINGTLPTEFASTASKMSEKWAHTLLSAVLAHEIQNEFFNRPFFCFDKDPNNGSESIGLALNAVYNQLLEGMRHSSHNLELSIN